MSRHGGFACAAVLLAACTDATTVDYTLGAHLDDNYLDRPASPNPPDVYLDGQRTDSIAVTYPDPGALLAARHTIELRYEGTVLNTLVVDSVPGPQLPDCAPTTWNVAAVYRDSGYLRDDGAGTSCDAAHGTGGTVDAATCDGCADGEQCTIRASHLDPLFSVGACAPIGPELAGEACSYLPDAAGAYSDCGAGLLCVDGTCHVRCPDAYDDTTPPPCTGCEYIQGMPEEITVCP